VTGKNNVQRADLGFAKSSSKAGLNGFSKHRSMNSSLPTSAKAKTEPSSRASPQSRANPRKAAENMM